MTSFLLTLMSTGSLISMAPGDMDIDLRFNGARAFLNLEQGRVIRFDERLNFSIYNENDIGDGRSTVDIQHEVGRAQGELRINTNSRHNAMEIELNARWRTPDQDCRISRVRLPVNDLPFHWHDTNTNGCAYSISFEEADW